jgi:hypothetical protein
LKQACIKIKDAVTRGCVLLGLGKIMYDRDCPDDVHMDSWAQRRLRELAERIPEASDFWSYFEKQWGGNTRSWVVGHRNLCYAGQDTNAAIESYHGNLKATLKQSKRRYHGRRVDWTIHQLVGDVLNHYWYASLRKRFGFVTNTKEEQFVIGALLKARLIPDSCVMLPSCPGAPAVVTSKSKVQKRYWVYNPGEELASCDCPVGMKGNICKHQVKVLKLMHPDIAEGTITRYCGSLKGTGGGGLRNMLEAVDGGYNLCEGVTSPVHISQAKPVKYTHILCSAEIEDHIHRLSLSILDDSRGNKVLLRHVLAAFLSVQGTMKNLKSDLEAGLLHPSQETVDFLEIQDNMGMSLKRRRDFLDRR